MKRRVYSNEFKIEAVKMIVDQEVSCAEVARQLGVSYQLLLSSKKQFDESGTQAFPGHGKRTPVEAKMER